MHKPAFSDRRARLVRALVAALVPLASSPVIGACGVCGPLETVIPISEEEATDLSLRFGGQSLPLEYCNALCGVPVETTSAATGAGGSGVGGGSGGAGGGNGVGGDGFASGPNRFQSVSECHLVTIDFEAPAVLCTGAPDCGGAGRRPPGLVATPLRADDGAGARFARMATLEQASIAAFVQLARELEALSAPATLVARAYAAARDEARHTKIATALARRHGVEPTAPVITPTPLRSLFEIAIDNAREGCVGETFAAVALAKQARVETDPFVARALAEIALDEAEHAALSFDLDAWLRGRLDPWARREVSLAEEAALSALAARGDGAHRVTLAEVRELCAA